MGYTYTVYLSESEADFIRRLSRLGETPNSCIRRFIGGLAANEALARQISIGEKE